MGHRVLTFGRDPVFFHSGSSTERDSTLVSRIRIVGLATLVAGLILAGASTATFAQDAVDTDEYSVISTAWWDFYSEEWGELTDSEWLAYESDLTELFEDATIQNCRVAAGSGAVAVSLLANGGEMEWYAGQTIVVEMTARLQACFWAAA